MINPSWEIAIRLPWPPTVNNYWRNVNNRTIISKKGREYKTSIKDYIGKYEEFIEHNFRVTDQPIIIHIEAWRPDKRRRDLDNILKSLLDSLQGIFYEDDSQIAGITIQNSPNNQFMLEPGSILYFQREGEVIPLLTPAQARETYNDSRIKNHSDSVREDQKMIERLRYRQEEQI